MALIFKGKKRNTAKKNSKHLSIEYRGAEEKDRKQLQELLEALHEVHHKGRPDIFRPAVEGIDVQVDYLYIMNNTIVAEDKETNQLVGFISYRKNYVEQSHDLADRQELNITDIMVKDTYRHHGIGKALIQTVKDRAKQGGFQWISLEVWKFNKSAFNFYKSIGMTPRVITMEQKL